jgi:hypothetical protein
MRRAIDRRARVEADRRRRHDVARRLARGADGLQVFTQRIFIQHLTDRHAQRHATAFDQITIADDADNMAISINHRHGFERFFQQQRDDLGDGGFGAARSGDRVS